MNLGNGNGFGNGDGNGFGNGDGFGNGNGDGFGNGTGYGATFAPKIRDQQIHVGCQAHALATWVQLAAALASDNPVPKHDLVFFRALLADVG